MADKDKSCGGNCGGRGGCGGSCSGCGGNCKCRQEKRIRELRAALDLGRMFLRAAGDLKLSDEELMKILALDAGQLGKLKKAAAQRTAPLSDSDELLTRIDCVETIGRGLFLFYRGNLQKCNEWLRKKWDFLNATPLEAMRFNLDGLEVVAEYVSMLLN